MATFATLNQLAYAPLPPRAALSGPAGGGGEAGSDAGAAGGERGSAQQPRKVGDLLFGSGSKFSDR